MGALTRHGLFWLAGLFACHGGGPEETASPCPDSADTGAIEAPTEWAWRAWAPPTSALAGVTGAVESVRAAGSDAAYLLDADRRRVHVFSRAGVQPQGQWCVEGLGGVADCEGLLITPGEIESRGVTHLCGNAQGTSLYLVRDDGRIDVAGTSWGGADWRRHHRVYRVLRPGVAPEEPLIGPCAAVEGGLVLSDAARLVRARILDDGTWQLRAEAALPAAPVELASAGLWVAGLDVEGGVSLFRAEGLEPVGQVLPRVDGRHIALSQDALWIASGYVLYQVPLGPDGPGEAVELPLKGVLDLELDARGLAFALAEEGTRLVLAGPGEVLAEQALSGKVVAMLPPGEMGDAVIVAEVDGEQRVSAYTPVPTPDLRPPLDAFVMTTLEQPFGAVDVPCTAAENEAYNWEQFLAQLRANASLLASLGVGVTWEFYSASARCGEAGILEELEGLGFELGYMSHSKPCYSCTDQQVAGLHPVQCPPTDPNYAAPGSVDACWPDHQDYCDLGDNDCWLAFMRDQALEVDRAIPGGARFILGADRHALWGWDWVDGYQRLPRADGSVGYDATLFIADWVYPEVRSLSDPRGKDPAPWEPARVAEVWRASDLAHWEERSSFSELAVMPGNSVSIGRLWEWESTGLTVVQLLTEGVRAPVNGKDAEVALALARHASARRSGEGPQSFYVHVPDLTSWSLSEPFGPTDDLPMDVLHALVQGMDEVPGARWRGPTAIRQDLP
ncbi:MAG: hypothetical protein JXX28_07400 [Deltaproteobacteria bacterium]|nr:hypothetical protein [Deltaproteobacteria bacterium]